MSVTSDSKIAGVLEWLENNAFWNSELVEVRPSPIGGLGVFWKLGPEQDQDNDNLLLRVPKSTILSPKNSFIFPMLVDYEPADETVDFTKGMHSIVITFIYEYSLGEKSPWFQYLDSFDIDSSDAGVPICLWLDEEKAMLFNSEADLLNMLDLSELIAFFLECVRFAEFNAKYVKTPSVLKIKSDVDADMVQKQFMNNLELFGRYVQAVISRAFTVDKYYGLSLVPGADLFNHLSPVISDEQFVERENVHFVCDDDDELCGECGEIGCVHLESDEEMGDDEIDDEEMGDEEMGDEENDEENYEENNDDEINEEDEDGFNEEGAETEGKTEDENNDDDEIDLIESDIELEESSESESESLEEELETSEVEINEEVEEKTTLTMEDIQELEMSEAETEQDEEEVSTLSLSEDENNHMEPIDFPDSELVAELADESKCCDIVLTSPASKEYNYELFNTYGNELANPYLLQSYGFVSAGNPNASCLLSVQMFAYLKKEKLHMKRKRQLEAKLAWYEDIGFEIVSDLVIAAASEDHDGDDADDESHDHERGDDHDEEDNGNERDKCCGEDDCSLEHNEKKTIEPPESWQLSPKIEYDGTPTEHTIALVRLLLLSFKVFHYKLACASSERKLVKRVAHHLLSADVNDKERSLIRGWVQGRLARYKETRFAGERGEMAKIMITQEKEVLNRALEVLDD